MTVGATSGISDTHSIVRLARDAENGVESRRICNDIARLDESVRSCRAVDRIEAYHRSAIVESGYAASIRAATDRNRNETSDYPHSHSTDRESFGYTASFLYSYRVDVEAPTATDSGCSRRLNA